MLLVAEIGLILRDIVLAVAGCLTGKSHRRYEHSIFVRAPREVVWRMLRSKDISFAGLVPLHIVITDVPDQPDQEAVRMILGEREMHLRMRIIDERPGQGLLCEIMQQGTDPVVIQGREDYLGFILLNRDGGTQLDMTREIVPTKWLASLTVPFGLRSAGRRYQTKAEEMAAAPDADDVAAAAVGSPPPAPPASSFGLTPNSIALSVLAFASFCYLWGWREAILISTIIILHELGHALAMMMVGIPVKGIYLVPFFGGAAIGASPYRSEGQLGFVALMGPGFSLVPTLAFALTARETGDPVLHQAAQLSAIINLVNLAPIMPLDGGQVLKAALVSIHRTAAQIAGFIGAGLGFWLAWWARDPVLGVFVGLGLLITFQLKQVTIRTPMLWPVAGLLMLAFLATIAAYLAIIYVTYQGRLGA